MALAESQQLIDERVRQGGSLAHVEEEIIDPAPYREEQKAALWLYASATIPRGLVEAVVETTKQPRTRLSRLSSALRSAPSAMSRTLDEVQRRAGEVHHGGA
jgi:hypothetical protein